MNSRLLKNLLPHTSFIRVSAEFFFISSEKGIFGYTELKRNFAEFSAFSHVELGLYFMSLPSFSSGVIFAQKLYSRDQGGRAQHDFSLVWLEAA
jgi:hypothetical protein